MSLVMYAPHKEVTGMGLENTITEQDLGAASQHFVQGFRMESKEFEPDLTIDGLSESIVSRLVRLVTFRRP